MFRIVRPKLCAHAHFTVQPEPEKNIRIATSTQILGPYSSASEPITGDYWAEGPTVIKINNKWHVYFDKYQLHQYGLLVSKNLNDWIDFSDDLELPAGIRHGTAFKVNERVLHKLLHLHFNNP